MNMFESVYRNIINCCRTIVDDIEPMRTLWLDYSNSMMSDSDLLRLSLSGDSRGIYYLDLSNTKITIEGLKHLDKSTLFGTFNNRYMYNSEFNKLENKITIKITNTSIQDIENNKELNEIKKPILTKLFVNNYNDTIEGLRTFVFIE
jgi:hypothetical protein